MMHHRHIRKEAQEEIILPGKIIHLLRILPRNLLGFIHRTGIYNDHLIGIHQPILVRTVKQMPDGTMGSKVVRVTIGRIIFNRNIPQDLGFVGRVDENGEPTENYFDYEITEVCGKKLLGEIEAVLQKKREIAVDVEVKAPTEKTVNMSAELTAEQGWTMQEITDAATAALQAYFTGERLGEAVYTAKLANILYGVEGVKNCHLLTPSADVSVSATELPVLGTVTITEIGAGEA